MTKPGPVDKRALAAPVESGVILKKGRPRIKMSLIYPNVYQVGMSNLGFQAVYGLANAHDDVFCERVFIPSLTSPAASLKTLETGRLAADADILAFSLSFENDYPHVLDILEACKIPLLAKDRQNGKYPLVLGGGVGSFLNPEPLALFFDAFLLGEAEVNLKPFLHMWDPDAPRGEMLRMTAFSLNSFYVPALYTPLYDQDRLTAFVPVSGLPLKLTPAQAADLTGFDTESMIVSKDTAFDDTYLIETGRGCPHGCRFCSASAIYFPPRFRSLAQIQKGLERGVERSGHIGLVGAAVSDFPHLSNLCPYLETLDARVSFSSFRADAISDDFLRLLQKSGVKSSAIAPEAGSQRMRDIINKNLTEEQILTAAGKLARGGVLNLKLYFMVGLPFEVESDVDAIIDLCRKIQAIFVNESRGLKRLGKINVTISAFVPKPMTPFQWCAMEPMPSIKAKLRYLKKHIDKIPNMAASGDASKQVLLQGVLARADRRASAIFLDLHRNGGNLSQTLKTHKDLAEIFLRGFGSEDRLPWDFLKTGRGKSYLFHEYQKAVCAETSGFCPLNRPHCTDCGICRI